MDLRWLACSLALLACDLVNTPTRTAKGELYQSGDGRYDPFFAQVHTEQVAASGWGDESKSSRRPLVSALELRVGASNALILGAVREKKSTASLGPVVESTIASERERAKKLAAAEGRLDDLLRRGEVLKKEAIDDRQNMGADKADDAKVKKKTEVKRELGSAVDAIETIRDDAKHGSAEADELATKLRSAWGGTDAAATVAPAPATKKPDSPRRGTRRPADVAPAERKPAPAAGEVFNP